MKTLHNQRSNKIKRIISVLLAIMLLTASFSTLTAYAKEGNEADGEYYTYYFLAPADWFRTNNSIGLYYFTPTENAKWPGIEITADDRVYVYDDGCAVYKVKIWQENKSTNNGEITTPCIYFNSFVDQNIDRDNFYFTNNINTEGYLPMDEIPYGSDTEVFPRYPENFEIHNFNNMIYVPNTDVTVVSDFSYKPAIGAGVWYYYYGNGEYGTERTKSGKCGNNVTWELDFVKHTLTISGEGDMNGDFGWKNYDADIENIVIGDKVTSIADGAFYGTEKLINVKLGKALTRIGHSAFSICYNLKEILIPNSVEIIDKYAFCLCESLENVTLGNSLKVIEECAFHMCVNLKSINFAYSLTDIGDGAFSQCSGLTDIAIPNSVKHIGVSAFCECTNLRSVKIPNNVEFIGSAAFMSCDSLKSVTIPKSVIKMEPQAFCACASLENIEVAEDNPEYCSVDGVLYNKDKTVLFCCPCRKTEVTIPNTVTDIEYAAFWGCKELKDIIIPDSVERIHAYAFVECQSFTKIVLPESITSIEAGTFNLCINLQKIYIPISVNDIYFESFRGCDKLTAYITEGSYAYSYVRENNIKYVIDGFVSDGILGDIDGDDEVKMEDVVLIQKQIAKLIIFTEEQELLADVNGDGDITMLDVTTVQKYIAKLINKF